MILSSIKAIILLLWGVLSFEIRWVNTICVMGAITTLTLKPIQYYYQIFVNLNMLMVLLHSTGCSSRFIYSFIWSIGDFRKQKWKQKGNGAAFFSIPILNLNKSMEIFILKHCRYKPEHKERKKRDWYRNKSAHTSMIKSDC